MSTSTPVAPDQLATAAEYNALRTDTVDNVLSHGHNSGPTSGGMLVNPPDEFLSYVYFDEEDIA